MDALVWNELIEEIRKLRYEVKALHVDAAKTTLDTRRLCCADIPAVALKIQAPRNEQWRIEITGDTFHFARYINGHLNETYRSVEQAEAAVWASAIIQGYEPPRRLCHSDRPPG